MVGDRFRTFMHPLGTTAEECSGRVYRASASTIDLWSTICTVVNNSLVLTWYFRVPNMPMAVLLLPSVTFVILAPIQYAWSVWRPDSYHPNRHFIYFLNRTMRLIQVGLMPWTFGQWSRISLQTAVNSLIGPKLATPTHRSAFSFFMVMSGTIQCLMNSIAVPLHFLPELLFHTLQLLLLTFAHTLTAAACLDVSPYTSYYLDACNTLHEILLFFLCFTCGSIADKYTISSTCHLHAPIILNLFGYLCIGFCLPLFISYRFDQRLVWQIRQAAAGRHPMANRGAAHRLAVAQNVDAAALAEPSLLQPGDLAIMLAAVMSCWFLVIATYLHLLPYMLPLPSH